MSRVWQRETQMQRYIYAKERNRLHLTLSLQLPLHPRWKRGDPDWLTRFLLPSIFLDKKQQLSKVEGSEKIRWGRTVRYRKEIYPQCSPRAYIQVRRCSYSPWRLNILRIFPFDSFVLYSPLCIRMSWRHYIQLNISQFVAWYGGWDCQYRFSSFHFTKIYFSIQRRLEAQLRNNFFDDLYIHIRGLTPKTSANTSAWRTLPVVENGRREDVFFFFFLVSCNLGPFGLLFRGRPLDKIPLDMLFYPATPSTNKLCFSFYCSIYFPILMLFSRLLPPLVVEHH